MPTIFEILGYRVYFWSNENNEPIHVHVCKGNQTENATKIWIPFNGNPILEHNKSKIPEKDLKRIMKYLAVNKADIVLRWYQHFNR